MERWTEIKRSEMKRGRSREISRVERYSQKELEREGGWQRDAVRTVVKMER